MKTMEDTVQIKDKVLKKFKAGLCNKKYLKQSIIRKWKEHGTTAKLPRHGHAPKLTSRARGALIRDAAALIAAKSSLTKYSLSGAE